MSSADEIYRELSIGEQLAHLEYVLTEDKLRLFQEAVDYSGASFPSIAVKEYIGVLTGKYGPIPVISAKHKDRYFSPPRPNKRVQVTGWVRDKYQRRGRSWLVVETFAVDEDGREIIRSEHTFLIGGIEKPEE